jgi:hypothetical protein
VAGDGLDTPVDLWWWLAFFDCGKRCGKLGGPPLLGWRQHPRQHTRTHGRLSLANLRRVKVRPWTLTLALALALTLTLTLALTLGSTLALTPTLTRTRCTFCSSQADRRMERRRCSK